MFNIIGRLGKLISKRNPEAKVLLAMLKDVVNDPKIDSNESIKFYIVSGEQNPYFYNVFLGGVFAMLQDNPELNGKFQIDFVAGRRLMTPRSFSSEKGLEHYHPTFEFMRRRSSLAGYSGMESTNLYLVQDFSRIPLHFGYVSGGDTALFETFHNEMYSPSKWNSSNENYKELLPTLFQHILESYKFKKINYNKEKGFIADGQKIELQTQSNNDFENSSVSDYSHYFQKINAVNFFVNAMTGGSRHKLKAEVRKFKEKTRLTLNNYFFDSNNILNEKDRKVLLEARNMRS